MCPQLIDDPGAAGREGVSAEGPQRNPAPFLRIGLRVRFEAAFIGVQLDLEPGVSVADGDERTRGPDLDSQLFPELAAEGFHEGLPGLPFSSREFPEVRQQA